MSARWRFVLLSCLVVGAAVCWSSASAIAAGDGSFVLTANSTGSSYAPTFTGNGLLGVRVPPAGQGYAAGTVPAQSELAGFYAKPSTGPASNQVQQRANIPTWSTLTFSDGGATFSPPCRNQRLAAIDRPAHRNRFNAGPVDGARRPRIRSQISSVH